MPATALVRRPLMLIVAGLAVVAAAIVLVLVARDGSVGGSAVPAPPVTSSPEHPCSNEITIYVDTDAEMQQVAEALRGDPRIGELTTETKQQAYERFKVIFKDRPELVEQARPEAMPASVRVTPAGRIPTSELARQLQAEFPDADEVSTILPC